MTTAAKARRYDLAVAGGGAAGLSAALAAAQLGVRVCLVERSERLGRKILATGNGRCNLSNTEIGQPQALLRYHNDSFAVAVIGQFPFSAIQKFFLSLGLLLSADERGWVYPHTRWANSVLEVLLNAIANANIDVYTQYNAMVSLRKDGDYLLSDPNHHGIIASAVVLASGKPPQTLGLEGLRQVRQVPVLGPLGVSGKSVRGLDGIRVICSVSLYRQGFDAPLAVEQGELLFRKQAVSGIAIFNLSRHARPNDVLSIDLFPDYSQVQLARQLAAIRDYLPEAAGVLDFLKGLLHSRLALTVARLSTVKPDTPLTDVLLEWLVGVLKDLRFTVTETAPARQAQVTRGGFATDGFSAQTLAANDYPGLYAAGECLDVDGPCGGYNLHWAWASGLCAGQNAARFAGASAQLR